MNKFNQLWIMPPLYHRVFDFLVRTTVNSRQHYQYEAIARYVAWFDNERWEEPSDQQICKILNWLHDNEFIFFEKKGEGGHISIVWSHFQNVQPMTEAEYNHTYLNVFAESYLQATGKETITNDDIQAVYELSANHVSLKKAVDTLDSLSKKAPFVPSVGFIKDYVFADICFKLASE